MTLPLHARRCNLTGMRVGRVFALFFIAPSIAVAQVVQPNGLVVPLDSMNGEQQLYTFFSGRGEAIDWIADGRSEPSRFSPLCEFTATFVLNEAGSRFGVGWYNATGSAPAEVYEIVPAGSPLGTTITGASIRDDPRYLGGEVGFALMRDPRHYTEARWNTVCDSGPCAGTPGPWVLSLSYASTVTANAWYIAFEDGDTSNSSWNNDGDYNDDVFFFTGIACAGAGQPCAVAGAVGICANGLTECGTGGAITCRMVNTPGTEVCDAADNDCDGNIDEGDALCDAGEVCFRGRCVVACQGEFGCNDPSTRCEDGLCVDAECVGVTCGEGLACSDGACVSPCDGVDCPGDQTCRVGVCVDACTGVTCDAGRVCEGGVCVEGCACRGCGAGRECASDGRCVDEGCAGVVCTGGTICVDGACVDACTGAVCPFGQICQNGMCVGGGVLPGEDAGGSGLDGSITGDGGGRTGIEGGCGCRASRETAPPSWLLMLAFVSLKKGTRRSGEAEK